ncbi:MAG: O-acetylhomoserine aminocarboxypropyltransferase/cysteine synthase [Clostridia bacterium]|nr:O-acetylhomoserine aminocarboxypropyltransferase/cysteine synthase [Clostridia bacterium]
MDFKIETKCVQSGYTPKNGEPRVIPIVQSTTYKYESSDQMGRLFDLEESGYFYTRLQNPTNDYVAAKIAELEGGVGAMLTSSGQAASFYSVFNICSAGDHVVAASAIYGGTFNLFNVTMRKLGIDFTFVKPDASEEELNAAFQENTKAVFAETISNPSLVVLDIEKYARVAHAHGVPLIVDNTFPTPINCRPFEFGADIVTHSTTKYMDGHATSVGGVIVDSGNFDWTQNDKFPGLTTPDDSYHGIVYTERFGKAAYITKCTSQLMRDLGSIQSPHNAFLLNVGLETLHLRMERHCSNALAVAKFLKSSDKIEQVDYPGLEGDKYYDLAQKYMPNGTCGVISLRIKGGRADAVRFMDSLKLAAIVTHVADCRTCCLHPASATHRQLSAQELEDCGVYENLVRLSVGIENVDDIIADLAQALENV